MTLIDVNQWHKLLKMYFALEVSAEFLKIADEQLSSIFEADTGIKIEHLHSINWSTDTGIFMQPNIHIYSDVPGQLCVMLPNGKPYRYSKISANLRLKHRSLDLFICWTSKTGNRYMHNSTDIDREDIEFWFEGLDVGKCLNYDKPDFANLILWPDLFAEEFQRKIKKNISVAFVSCMNTQLTEIFKNKVGLKIKNLVAIVIDKELFYNKKLPAGRLTLNLSVNSHYNMTNILWQSKSGKAYDISDENIDCSDIEFWFDNLNVVEYHKQMSSDDVGLTFKIKNLSFELIVNRIQTNCDLTLTLKPEIDKAEKSYAVAIEDFIMAYNKKSEAKKRDLGVVHNLSYTINGNQLEFSIDIGSVGIDFFNKLFQYLSDMNVFTKVEVD